MEIIVPEERVSVTVVALNGVETARFTCTMEEVEETFHATVKDRGIYLLHIQGKLLSTVKKVMIP